MSEDPDRQAITAAAARLLAGTPHRSSGELTVVALATEAGVKRWKLTHRHTDLMRAFQAEARSRDWTSPLVEPWQRQVRELEQRNRELRHDNADLRARLARYARTIDDLTVTLHTADNDPRQVTALHPTARHSRS
jgi:hypothetical protein